jgi:hypothetical protein
MNGPIWNCSIPISYLERHWFWTLPEVHEAQKEIDARNAELRRLINQTL